MAKKQGRKEGPTTSYFRSIFKERPDWLQQKSNNDVLARYRADHQLSPEAEVDPKVKNTLANLKSMLRKDLRTGGGSTMTVAATRPTHAPGGSVSHMELLEEKIDDCLTIAKSLDPEGLKSIIRNLRSARNEVVWRMGQP